MARRQTRGTDRGVPRYRRRGAARAHSAVEAGLVGSREFAMPETVPEIACAVGVATAVPTKLIVAVHGVGDQIGYETVQTVAARVGAYCGVAAALPLGRFYSGSQAGQTGTPSPQLMVNPPDPQQFAALKLGFAEVYWAPIAREVTTEGHTLENTQKWVQTISARVAAHQKANWGSREHDRLVTV